MKRKIAVFASGSGTNAENIIRYFTDNLKASVVLVITNKRDAFVIKRAEMLGVPIRVVSSEDVRGETALLLDILQAFQVDFIVLAGFLLKLPKELIEAYPRAIVNIHPSLLPKYGGKGMYGNKVHEAVVAAGDIESGITIHYINEYFDEGEFIFQQSCSISSEDTWEKVAEKVHDLEYRYYPTVIESLL